MSKIIDKKICISACPGDSNVSLLASELAEKIGKKDGVRFVKLTDELEQDAKMVKEEDENAKEWILIDGCQRACGMDAFKEAGIVPEHYFVITDLGIERKNNTNYTEEEFETVQSIVNKVI